jgi:hypothetical protein
MLDATKVLKIIFALILIIVFGFGLLKNFAGDYFGSIENTAVQLGLLALVVYGLLQRRKK